MLRTSLIVELDEFFGAFLQREVKNLYPHFRVGKRVFSGVPFSRSIQDAHISDSFSWVAFSSVIKKAQNVWETYKALVYGNPQWFDQNRTVFVIIVAKKSIASRTGRGFKLFLHREV